MSTAICTTKEQVIEGTLKGMDEIGEYSREMKEYVRRRLERAYELGYYVGWTSERSMNEKMGSNCLDCGKEE
jgi:hypothetical protein